MAKGALSKAKGSEIQFIAGKLADAESLIALKVRVAVFFSSFLPPEEYLGSGLATRQGTVEAGEPVLV